MDISSLREKRSSSELTVSELNSYIKRIFDNDRMLSGVSVKGEISNFTYHRTGHLYFSLKDEGGQVKAVMFRSSAASLKFMPENGMKVIVRCSVNVYMPSGSYQLYVTSMQPDGVGALYLAYEQLKAKLEAEGLFSEQYKKSIPLYPSRIGVITSPTGAAVRDIINVTGRRYPAAAVYLYPSLVQGEGAEDNLLEGLDYFEKSGLVDVIIIGRGGGSIEDLWAFNGERLARKIFDCKIPIISAVGHETDFTICDFVADLRAPTPSAAAEIAVPDARDLLMRLDSWYDRAENALIRVGEHREERLNFIKSSSVFKNPVAVFDDKTRSLTELADKLAACESTLLEKKATELSLMAGKLHALSPLATLARGYSVVYTDDQIIRCIDSIDVGQTVKIRLNDGEISADVTEKKRSRKNEKG